MSDADLTAIIESARRLGVELDEQSTLQWLAAIAASNDDSGDVVIDTASGTFGHRVSMLDFSPRDLARFRRIGEVVEVTGPAGVAESALALSGSAAQSKIQTFPGDCDYFQRLNIIAPTREEACAILARLLRDHVLARAQGPTYQFLEGKLGSWPVDATQNGVERAKGSPISWRLPEIEAGELRAETVDGPLVLRWHEVALDPGWCKLDWVVADEGRQQLANASNVIDVTWEAPDGEIVPLDGYLDAFFQEVYLDAADVPTFAKVARFVSDSALDDYVVSLEGEVRKYLTRHLNYGKAAKRMYNLFRLSGRHLDAAFVRELFDEPTTILYQVSALVTTLQNATQPGTTIPIAAVQAQADALVVEVVTALDGDEEAEVVKSLVRLRQSLDDQNAGQALTAEAEGAQTHLVNLINTFYRDRLVAMPSIKEYIDAVQAEAAAG